MNNYETSFISLGSTNLGKESFWHRQFAATPTTPQLVFDVVMGLLAPVVCFYFDPIVFQGTLIGPVYSGYQLFAYSVTAIAVFVLLVWLLFGRRLRSIGALLGGFLYAGAVFSVVIGLAILPFSLMGLLLLIGVFGFTPFFTAFAYWRNGRRALLADVDYAASRSWFTPIAIGFILALGLPTFASMQVSRTLSNSIDAIIYGEPSQAEVAVIQLKWLPFIPQAKLDQIVDSYLKETDNNRKQQLKKYYLSVTGVDIDHRVWILND